MVLFASQDGTLIIFGKIISVYYLIITILITDRPFVTKKLNILSMFSNIC